MSQNKLFFPWNTPLRDLIAYFLFKVTHFFIGSNILSKHDEIQFGLKPNKQNIIFFTFL